jgi:hypothetical protein
MEGRLPLFKTFVCLYRQTGTSWPSPLHIYRQRLPLSLQNVSVYTDKVPVNQYIPALLPPRYEWCVEDSQHSSCCLPCSSLSPNVLYLRLAQRRALSTDSLSCVICTNRQEILGGLCWKVSSDVSASCLSLCVSPPNSLSV